MPESWVVNQIRASWLTPRACATACAVIRPACPCTSAAAKGTETSMLREIPARVLVPAILLASLVYANSVRAEVGISGPSEAIQFEVRDAPVQEVLPALRASFGLQYRAVGVLDRRISGTYEGSLQRVVRRVLEGYDFIVKTDSGTVEVMLIGAAMPGEINWAPAAVAPMAIPNNPTPQRRRRSK